MVEKVRNDLLEYMMSLDKNDMDMETLKLYAETLNIVSSVQLKSYTDTMVEMIQRNSYGFGTREEA